MHKYNTDNLPPGTYEINNLFFCSGRKLCVAWSFSFSKATSSWNRICFLQVVFENAFQNTVRIVLVSIQNGY